MKKNDLLALAAGLASGLITEDAIKDEYGDSVLTDVLAFAGGSVVGGVAADLTKKVLENEIVDDVTSALTFGIFD